MPSEVKVKAEEPPRALREVERLTRNPEKLANAGGRCWKDTLGSKRSFKTHRPPYPARRGLITAWQKDQETLIKMEPITNVGNDVNGSRTRSRNGVESGRGGED